jgi:hypothetical protein
LQVLESQLSLTFTLWIKTGQGCDPSLGLCPV